MEIAVVFSGQGGRLCRDSEPFGGKAFRFFRRYRRHRALFKKHLLNLIGIRSDRPSGARRGRLRCWIRMVEGPSREMKLKIPPGDFSAYLFDCDGTIADSMPLHYIAWKQALGEWNCEFEEKLFYEWGGMPIVEIVATLNRQRGLDMPVEEVAHRKEDLYFRLLPRLKAVPGNR